MNFGEKIYNLRTQNNLSQGELADKLDVSRQSVSKWENNVAVPELDKIIRMSEIFGVTVDALVKGEEQAKQEAVQPQTVVQVLKKERMEKRVLAGILLLSLGGVAFFLLLALTGIGCIYAIPVLLFGTICLLFKKDVGFYCVWLLYLLVTGYLAFGSAASSWRVIRYTFRGPYQDNPVILIIGWIWFAAMLAMMVWSVARFYKRPIENKKQPLLFLFCSVGYLIADFVAVKIMFSHYMQLLETQADHTMAYNSILAGVNAVSTIIQPVAFAIVLVQISRLLYNHFSKKRSSL